MKKIMKKIINIAFVMLCFVFISRPIYSQTNAAPPPVSSNSPPAKAENITQENKTPSAETTLDITDIKTVRKIIAENKYLKKKCEELERQCDEWKTSSASWQNLYDEEKSRADNVLDALIVKLRESNAESAKSNLFLRDQHRLDKDRINTLEFSNRKLKSQRWQFAAASAATGGAAGFVAGYFIRDRLGGGVNTFFNRTGDLAGNRLVSFQF